MTVDQVLNRIRELGDPRAVAIWERMTQLPPDRYLGAGLTKLKNLAKEIKKDHDLAVELWETRLHDAKLLSTMVEEPKKATVAQLEKQVAEIYTWDLADKYAQLVVSKHSEGQALADQWRADKTEMIRRTAMTTASELAKKNKKLADEYFATFLDHIREHIAVETNWAKEGMINALMGIGSRNAALHAVALEIAEANPGIEIDYGDTSCKTPDYLAYLQSERVREKIGA